jgi:leukotriene-A4 hydrolase
MPNVYPMSGMANPMLTYTSQTTIVGDKSQEFVLIRNAAQHWTGAVVTNNNWEDQWLNEGLTTYIERMVEAQLDTITYAYVEAYVGNSTLARQTSVIGVQNETYSTLHPVLHGNNPDYAFS